MLALMHAHAGILQKSPPTSSKPKKREPSDQSTSRWAVPFAACTHIALYDPFFARIQLLHHIAITKPQPSVFMLYQAFKSQLSILSYKPGLRFQQTVDHSQTRSL
jgi:hypothetical protein